MRRLGRDRTLPRSVRDASLIEQARSPRRVDPLQFRTHDFEWSADLRETAITLMFAGSLDADAVKSTWPGLERTASIERTMVVLDLAQVDYIDRMGLRLLLRLQLLAEGLGSRLVLSRPSRVVRRLMEVVGIADQFDYADSNTSAKLWCPSCGRELVPSLSECPHCGSPL